MDNTIGQVPTYEITYVPIKDLIPNPNNARTHSKEQIQQLAASVQTFGFINPPLVDRKNKIIAGHGRIEGAKLLGIDKIPIIRIEHLTEDQIRAYILADNRLAEKAGWDREILAIELQHLLTIDVDFDVTVTGFEMPEIDLILQEASAPVEEEPVEIDPEAPLITKPGDLWILGTHRILCGNALQEDSYSAVLDGKKAQMAFIDSPYNVPIDGHASGLGKTKHKDFLMASGEMSSGEYTGFLGTGLRLTARYSEDGSIHYVCIDWRHMGELLAAGNGVYSELKNLCVWNKDNGGMGTLYRSKHELIFVFKNGTAPHVNNVELGKHGRNRTNVWDYPGQSSLHANREEELGMHPTVKPVAMVADALLDCSHRNGIVLDPFGGSGTTLIAAENTDRHARLIEIEPRYVDVTIRRWQKHTGQKAVHAVTGIGFEA